MTRKCLECGKIPSFNYQGEKIGIYCNDHKKDGMVDVKNKKCIKCGKIPSFNYNKYQ